jgi:hypothetical protein
MELSRELILSASKTILHSIAQCEICFDETQMKIHHCLLFAGFLIIPCIIPQLILHISFLSLSRRTAAVADLSLQEQAIYSQLCSFVDPNSNDTPDGRVAMYGTRRLAPAD